MIPRIVWRSKMAPSLYRNISRYNSAFVDRHVGPTVKDQQEMLQQLTGNKSGQLSDLIKLAVPESINKFDFLNKNKNVAIPSQMSEVELIEHLKKVGEKNVVKKSFIGLGFYNSITPQVIVRNILENPGWYTSYTPYQAEISQGRLELLFYFQSMISNLTKLPVASASLLDQSSACVEAMNLCIANNNNINNNKKNKFIILKSSVLSKNDVMGGSVFPQDFYAMNTRAVNNNYQIDVMSLEEVRKCGNIGEYCGLILQAPDQYGSIEYFIDVEKNNLLRETIKMAKEKNPQFLAACSVDIMASLLYKINENELFDVMVGSTQRFGLPLGYGGPHAGFISVSDKLKRMIPGRIVGKTITKFGDGKTADGYRLTLQTREQHIKREKATSNICTAQAMLACMSTLFAMYHGRENLIKIAKNINTHAKSAQSIIKKNENYTVLNEHVFDTLTVKINSNQVKEKLLDEISRSDVNIRLVDMKDNIVAISFDEVNSNEQDLKLILGLFSTKINNYDITNLVETTLNEHNTPPITKPFYEREISDVLPNKMFDNSLHSEHLMTRYIKKLERKDLSLTNSMIPLGSCTMKLNAVAELRHLTNENFANMHPFAPKDQTTGYTELLTNLGNYLKEITGMDAYSFHSNSGAQGEYLGLIAINNYFRKTNQKSRHICLIPGSSHGTNPASAKVAGLTVVPVATAKTGGICVDDLSRKIEQYTNGEGDCDVACAMITYPGTTGVYDPNILKISQLLKSVGAQVYMDGANMNAQVGICAPGDLGVDVCHLNLHKTFAIPHGGGGPGMGPICVKSHLADCLPKYHSVDDLYNKDYHKTQSVIGSSCYGSASILTIPYSYIRLLGRENLHKASSVAILNANYAAMRLSKHYDILYFDRDAGNFVGHEFIINMRPFKDSANVDCIDVSKRLIDYGFHSPTVSWPIPMSLMVEPTESEDKMELDRFCDALIEIRKEISLIETGKLPKDNNMLKNAPHTAEMLACPDDKWNFPYTREQAVYPLNYLRHNKYWPPVTRVDDSYGDKNLFCSCEF